MWGYLREASCRGGQDGGCCGDGGGGGGGHQEELAVPVLGGRDASDQNSKN